MNYIFGAFIGFFGAFIGFVLGLYAMIVAQSKQEPFDIGEAQAVLVKLRPYARFKTDTYIYLWGDGAVHIKLETIGGSKFRGEGKSLKEAIADMQSKSELVGKALKE